MPTSLDTAITAAFAPAQYFATFSAAFIISFWPLNAVLTSLFLSTAFYGLIGSGQLFLGKRLFRKNVIEYLQVFLLIFILVLFTVNYRN